MKSSASPPGKPPGLSRRAAAKIATVSLAGIAAGGGMTAMITRVTPQRARPYRFLHETEAALVIEICEQIIPRDDVAGATDAGVVYYIDRQLAGKLARHQATYREGLAAFAQTCLRLHQKPFAQLDAQHKIAVMQLVERGKAPAELWKEVAQAEFFKLLVEHTMQGFYGSPRHGGNRDYVSHKMLGIDYPQIIGQNRPKRT
jgi:gluconate 2-dehydrogenase gamma chain